MKNKTKKRLIIWLSVIVAVLVIGFIGFRLALNFAGDKAMEMLMENQINSMLDSGEITLEELEAIVESEPVTEQNAEEPEAAAEAEEKAEKTQTPSGKQSGTKTQTKAETKKETAPATRQETVKKATDKLAFGITRADKDEMMKLISKRLSGSDISYLSGLLSGGLTREERSAAAKIAYERFQGEELQQVSDFYHKYKKAIMIEPDWGVEE